MNGESAAPMEGEIITEEQQVTTPKATKVEPPKLKFNFKEAWVKLKTVKIPKLRTLILLTILLITILVGFMLLSSGGNKTPEAQPNVVIASPIPSAKTSLIDPNIEGHLQNYDKKIDSFGKSTSDFSPPQVDLDIKF